MIRLERIAHGQKSPRAYINIEMAHISWAGPRIYERFSNELNSSLALLKELNLDKSQFRISKSILIDDHRILTNNKVDWFLKEISGFESLFADIDYLTFESDLKQLLTVFYSKLNPSASRSIQNNIERYIANSKRTACSHDIALWHCLRLGVFGYQGLPVYQLDDPSRAKRNSLCPSFCADRVASILNISNREHEEDAESDLLRHLNQVSSQSIQRYYYY